MRDTLPNKIKEHECGIVNLDSVRGPGTHYGCYFKNKKYGTPLQPKRTFFLRICEVNFEVIIVNS